MAQGWEDYKIRYLGGLSILVECPTMDAVNNILSNKDCWVYHWIDSLSQWNEDLSPVIEVEDMSTEDTLMHKVAALVHTKRMEDIKLVKPVLINKRSFFLRICEEKHRVVVDKISSDTSDTKTMDSCYASEEDEVPAGHSEDEDEECIPVSPPAAAVFGGGGPKMPVGNGESCRRYGSVSPNVSDSVTRPDTRRLGEVNEGSFPEVVGNKNVHYNNDNGPGVQYMDHHIPSGLNSQKDGLVEL
ncbi:hypothetical protein Tco_0854997 [Tanacetum coccineum]